jgi:hypothetical protein
MHLKKYPTYFVKNGARKAVYYTVDARQLSERGWTEESVKPAEPVKVTGVPIPITKPEPVAAKPEPVEVAPEVEEDVNLDEMTRAELVVFAEKNDIEFKSYAPKAEILEACKEFVNG